mmetsp:Transcript_58364/g.136449  ORF Transcript_58364/g.136449 Transcript_58364/m.136449 type:complete len:357 (+) Transcript_58364:76-1146(+)
MAGLPETIKTPVTELFGIKHPIMLAGMNVAAGPDLAAAVSNAGGLGVIGGVGYSPDFLRAQIAHLKGGLKDKSAPFGVDLLIPQVGGSARKTNVDYTGGQLPGLIDVVIEEKASLFVCAVGVPPKFAVDKLHQAGIPVMNMIGHPKHVEKCLEAGCDMICAQGGEGGGHTGDVATSILIPKVVDLCRGKLSPLTGKPVAVVAAGGIYDGRGLAMALNFGADAVWVGTRFVASTEAGATKLHKAKLCEATVDSTVRTLIYTGRPLRTFRTDYVNKWEERQEEIKALTKQGIIPVYKEEKERKEKGEPPLPASATMMMLMGQCAGVIDEVQPADTIISEMVSGAIEVMRRNTAMISKL